MYFTVDELDLSSWGVVEAIEDCPEIVEGDGEVVISRFKTLQAEVMTRVTLADGSEILGTSVHPVWSIEAEDWVPLADLVAGDRLQTRSGEMEIDTVETFAYRQSVYNFEVHTEHVYEIGELGVLVHNAAGDSCKLGNKLTKAGFEKPKGKIELSNGKKIAKWEAAHIVPSGKASGKHADTIIAAREKLKAAGIDINDAVNGFWSTKGHAGTHTDKYFERLGQLINSDTPNNAVAGKLNKLWLEIKRGDF